MAEDRNTETFALGLIVAAIIFFLFRRQLERAVGGGMGRGGSSGGGGGNGKGCCGGCSGGTQAKPSNPGTSIGNQSYNAPQAAFPESSLAAANHPSFFEEAYGS